MAIDPSAGSIFALHDDGWLLLWSTRHGELRHSAPLLTKEEASCSLCHVSINSLSMFRMRSSHELIAKSLIIYVSDEIIPRTDRLRQAARLPSGSVLTADPSSGLYLFNATWLDSTVHFLEPLAADTVTTVRVMAAEAERHDSASELLYLHEMQLLLVGTPGDDHLMKI